MKSSRDFQIALLLGFALGKLLIRGVSKSYANTELVSRDYLGYNQIRYAQYLLKK